MKYELYIAGYPGLVGGANTEMLHAIDLWRAHDIAVTLVPMFDADPAARAHCDSIGCTTTPYHPEIFKDRIVVAFNNLRALCRLPEIMKHGPPREWLNANCMTDAHLVERKCHAAGWITRHIFVSEYQRQRLLAQLAPIRDVKEVVGYRPYFNPRNALQPIEFRYKPPGRTFTIGRISRDDPAKFSADAWSLYRRIDTGARAKRVFMLGFGDRAREAFGNPPPELNCTPLAPGTISAAEFYDCIDVIVHKTGGSRESYCRVVPEAYAAGVPLVVERDFAFPELIDDGVTGFLCDSSEEMAERASLLARDEKLRREVIFAGREHLKKRISPPDLCWNAWERFFHEAA